MKKQGWQCPYCGNKDRELIETNNPYPTRILRSAREEETLLCVAIVPKGKKDTFDEVSDGTAKCGMQWDPQDET